MNEHNYKNIQFCFLHESSGPLDIIYSMKIVKVIHTRKKMQLYRTIGHNIQSENSFKVFNTRKKHVALCINV